MIHNNLFHALTKHGRQRFIERIGDMSDKAMLEAFCTGLVLGQIKTGFYYIWTPDWKRWDTIRLKTVCWAKEMRCLAPIIEIMDRPSDFTFNFNEFKRRFNNG